MADLLAESLFNQMLEGIHTCDSNCNQMLEGIHTCDSNCYTRVIRNAETLEYCQQNRELVIRCRETRKKRLWWSKKTGGKKISQGEDRGNISDDGIIWFCQLVAGYKILVFFFSLVYYTFISSSATMSTEPERSSSSGRWETFMNPSGDLLTDARRPSQLLKVQHLHPSKEQLTPSKEQLASKARQPSSSRATSKQTRLLSALQPIPIHKNDPWDALIPVLKFQLPRSPRYVVTDYFDEISSMTIHEEIQPNLRIQHPLLLEIKAIYERNLDS